MQQSPNRCFQTLLCTSKQNLAPGPAGKVPAICMIQTLVDVPSKVRSVVKSTFYISLLPSRYLLCTVQYTVWNLPHPLTLAWRLYSSCLLSVLSRLFLGDLLACLLMPSKKNVVVVVAWQLFWILDYEVMHGSFVCVVVIDDFTLVESVESVESVTQSVRFIIMNEWMMSEFT